MAHQGPSNALSGLRVLDLTRVRAGPACCRVFADFGADVIKIDATAGADPNEGMSGPRHGYDMLNLHRNKRSLTLNLKKPEGLDVFKRLVETADIVVENFRPDVKDRLGIGYENLKAINKRIILASISGFGQDGPYASLPGFDQIAQGMGGLMAVTGLPGQGPIRAGAAIADISSGLYAAIGIFVALQERARSGEGQWVQSSLLEAQIAVLDFQAARYLVDGVVPEQSGNDHPYSTPMGVFATSDGFINLGVGGDGHWKSLCGVFQKPDWVSDPKFATGEARLKNRPEIKAMIEPLFRSRSSEEWMRDLANAGVPAGPIYRMDEVFDDPQVRHLGMAVPCTHPIRGEISLVGQPVKLSRTPAAIHKSSPDAGAHSDELLDELGFSEADKARLRAVGAV
ncbi:MAG: CaiB/BaiF CoA transferase family protein [Rhodospirillales bacterium]|jgi:crotonobetainyl-CoA:carnitine CoA-transferase CaiB-like acyl-CoA transferase